MSVFQSRYFALIVYKSVFIVSVPTISYKGKISFPKEMIPLPPVAASADMCYNKPI
jgi:hypothetical protein